jgi:uncharacterized protein (UPF0333 family)
MKKLIFLVIVLAVGIGVGIYFQRQPKAQKIETQVEQAGADVKAGLQKAGDAATNVVGQVKVDAQKVVEFTTNAAGEIKQKLN